MLTIFTLKLDVTSVLASGLPNPNFGRPFLADSGFGSSKTTLREAFRATAYYDLDFKRFLRPDSLLAKIIGRHVFTSNYTSQSRDYVRWLGIDGLGLDYLNQEETQFAPAAPASTFRVFSGLREVIYAVYVGPSMVGKPGPQNQGIQGLQQPIRSQTPDPQTSRSITMRLRRPARRLLLRGK